MAVIQKKEGIGLFKSVLVAYSILSLHVVLIAGIGILVLFFNGIVNYMLWILIAGVLAILIFGSLFYRRMKKEGKTLRETLRSPLFNGRPVEVSLLGGLASFRMGRPGNFPLLENDLTGPVRQLEDPAAVRIRELSELARLLENDLITPDEFNKAKQQIFKS
jgi:hypothetical protein